MKRIICSIAKELCSLRSTWCLLFVLRFSFRALWHKSAPASVGQSNEQHTWRKKGYGCPWLCSLCQILQCFAPGANPNLIYTTANQLHLWGCYYSALLLRRLWAEAGPARASRCSSVPRSSGTSINNYRRYVKEPSMVSLAPRISVIGASIGKIFSQSQ